VDIRHLKCFVAVAEELHFRRAAERIGIAQAVLSAHVKRLEEELGFPLLFRTTRHVSLTQAGYVFLDEARAVLDQLDAAVEKATIAAHSGFDNLRIGGIDAAVVWFLPPILKAFHTLHPGIQLRLTEVAASGIQVEELSRHHIDLAFFRPPISKDGVLWEVLFEEGVYIALPEDDPLSGCGVIEVQELSGRRLISYPRHARPYLSEMVAQCMARVEDLAVADIEVLDKSTLLPLVALGSGVGLVPQWLTELPVDGVKYVRLKDAPVLQFGVAWRERDANRSSLLDFLQLACEEADRIRARFNG